MLLYIMSSSNIKIHQEYKRLSRDMETETEEEYLMIYERSSGSFSSSVSLSDRSMDNVIEEYHSDAPFAGRHNFEQLLTQFIFANLSQ